MGKRMRARNRQVAMAAAVAPVRADWCRIENVTATRSACVYLYDEIGYFGTSASEFAQQLADLDVDSIELRINSPGGEVFDGVAIYNTLKNHKAAVHVIVDGLAASAASFIAMAGATRTMMRGATMMIHDASTLAWGDAGEMRRTADLLDKLSDTIADIYTQRCGKDAGYWRDLMREETWFNATEAVEHGLADAVGGDQDGKDDEPAEGPWDLSTYRYAGRSKAPAPTLLAKPADKPVEAVDDYDPGQRRDDDGKWSDGMPGDIVATALAANGRDLGIARGGDGTLTLALGDTSVTLTADEAREVSDWAWDAAELEDGDLYMLQRDSHVLAALIRDNDTTWRFGVSTSSDPLADPVTLHAGDLEALGNKMIQVEGAHRLDTAGGRVDMWVTDDHKAGLRMRDADRNVVEAQLRPSEFDKVRNAVQELSERADTRRNRDDAADEDADDYEEADDPADDSVDILTDAGVVQVAIDGDAVTVGPQAGGWTVRLAGDQRQAWVDAAARTVDALDRLVDVWNTAVWRMTRDTRSTPVRAEQTDPWASLTAHLMTSGSSTVEDPLARLREAHQ